MPYFSVHVRALVRGQREARAARWLGRGNNVFSRGDDAMPDSTDVSQSKASVRSLPRDAPWSSPACLPAPVRLRTSTCLGSRLTLLFQELHLAR